MRTPEGLERSESTGMGLRVFVGEKSAIVSSSDISHQAHAEIITRAIAMAKLAPDDAYSTLAPESLLATQLPDLELADAQEPSVQWLQEQCAIMEDIALATPGITNSEGADAGYGKTAFALATSHGFAAHYTTTSTSISVSVLAGTGTGMERDYEFSSARFLSDLAAAEAIGRQAAERTLKRLNPKKVSTGTVPVVFDPRVSKGLISTLASAINGSSIARGTSFLKDSMGKTIFHESITIMDEPHRKRGLGSRPFDAEGVTAKATTFIDNGVLQSWVLDTRSANKLALTTTGHASRGLSSSPSPSTSNLTLLPGALTPDALMQDIKSGFYVTEVFGMGVNLVTGDYSQGASGFWIENGVIAYPVSELTIAGKLKDMFLHMTPADDLVLRYATNAPTIRVEGMTVAGQ